MPLEDICVHTCTPLRTVQADNQPDGPVDGGVWIEGEWFPLNPGDSDDGGTGGPGPDRDTPFDGCLFLPVGQEGAGAGANVVVLGGRQVQRPTLLYLPDDRAGNKVALDREDEVGIVAPELNEARGMPIDTEEVWQVDGSPQPFGKPGEDVIGFQAHLTRVEEE